ncbi:MAG: cell division protein FtsX, partial [Minisyncoccota bacterium]
MPFWVNAKRVARYGVAGFVRNGFISLAAVVIMTITLFVVAFLMIAGAALSSTLSQLTDKVDVSVYFTTSATEEQVFDVRRSLEALPEVASVSYVSRDQALADFRERHAND